MIVMFSGLRHVMSVVSVIFKKKFSVKVCYFAAILALLCVALRCLAPLCSTLRHFSLLFAALCCLAPLCATLPRLAVWCCLFHLWKLLAYVECHLVTMLTPLGAYLGHFVAFSSHFNDFNVICASSYVVWGTSWASNVSGCVVFNIF